MASGFVDKLPGGIEVTKRPAEFQWGDVNEDSPPKAVGHTTQTTSLPSYREGQRDAPTFTVGEHNVWQHRGLMKGCGTLQNDAGGTETNTIVRLQIEIIGFSSRRSWLPDSAFQRDALAAIKQLAKQELDIPIRHVHPDKQDQGVIASEAYPRRHEKFPNVPGWYAHVEVPENDHWDWGSLRWDDLEGGAGMVEALAFVERFKNQNGKWKTREISPFFANRASLRDWAVRPDGNNVDTDDELRKSLFNAMIENRVWVAKRLVDPAEDPVLD
jgi:hypothetical protein